MENDERFMKSDFWQCPLCGATITVYVKVTEPPLCYNRTNHSSKVAEMQLIDGNVKQEKG